ncbi:adhesion G protein-coupled receptor E5 isoform 2-T2 [Mantella aurantiaca]
MDGYRSFNETLGNRVIIACDDILECINGTHACGANTRCINTEGGYYCVCNQGFHRGNTTKFCPSDNKAENVCSDIDECKEDPNPCASNGTCKNTIGSYQCICNSGFRNISNKCIVKCNQESKIRPECKDTELLCMLKAFIESRMPLCNDNGLEKLQLDKLLDDLNDLISKFTIKDKKERLRMAGMLLDKVEGVIQNLAYLFHEQKSFSNKNNFISSKITNRTSQDKEISLSNRRSSILVDARTALGNAYTSVVGSLEYGNLGKLLEGAELQIDSKSQRVKLVSPVVSVFLGIGNTANLSQPIQLHINFTEEVTSNNTYCAFWSVDDAAWSTDGCVTLESDQYGIVCNCSHLTSFAVLMALDKIESWTLELITKIGLSISIVCLVFAIITFCSCRFLRGTRNTIHIHLCVSLLLGHCIFLIGIEATYNRAVCGIVAGLLHFFYLSSFCWMSLEGLELYLMLVTVFKTQLKTRYLVAAGYGVPTVIIIISAIVFPNGYGTEEYCWLSMKRNFIWSFMGPVCVIILVNCGIFVLTVWKLAEKITAINPEQGKLKRIRTLTVTSIAQLCILGCCWAFGFLMFGKTALFFAYAFTICNVLQGVQIFFLHCLMNKKVRETYSDAICAIVHFRSPLYSEFSNSSNVNTQSRAKTSKESGL